MKKIAIASDCTCDLSEKLLQKYNIHLFYYYIHIDNGRFKDTDEITADNIIEYLDGGGRKMMTVSPDSGEIYSFYQRILEKYDEIIHISVSSKISDAYEHAMAEAKKFGGRIKVIDGMQLSAATGQMLIRAAELVEKGKNMEEIVAAIEDMKSKVSTTFVMHNADGFYRTGRVNRLAKELVRRFNIHPVVTIKNGSMCLKTIIIGNFEKSVLRYVKNELKNIADIDKKHIIITHSNCRVSLITQIKQQIAEQGEFENLYVTRSSATITGNCGANTVGIFFVKKVISK